MAISKPLYIVNSSNFYSATQKYCFIKASYKITDVLEADYLHSEPVLVHLIPTEIVIVIIKHKRPCTD